MIYRTADPIFWKALKNTQNRFLGSEIIFAGDETYKLDKTLELCDGMEECRNKGIA